MNVSRHIYSLIFFVLLLNLGGCMFKEENLPIQEDVVEVTATLHQSFYDFEIFGGTNNSNFEVENFGLNGIYSLTRSQADDLQGKDKTLFDCIKSVNPSVIQLVSIKNSTDTFSACRKGITPSLIQEIIDVQKEHNDLRVALIEKFQKQEISEEVLILGLLKIRNDLKQKVLAVKNKYDDALRACLLEYIKNIKKALNKDQWNDFKKCI